MKFWRMSRSVSSIIHQVLSLLNIWDDYFESSRGKTMGCASVLRRCVPPSLAIWVIWAPRTIPRDMVSQDWVGVFILDPRFWDVGFGYWSLPNSAWSIIVELSTIRIVTHIFWGNNARDHPMMSLCRQVHRQCTLGTLCTGHSSRPECVGHSRPGPPKRPM